MAQEKTARKGNKTFKKVIGNVWDWIADAAEWCWKNIPMVIIFTIGVIIIFCTVYFWPCFILWSIFAPRTAAHWLYGKEREENFPVLSELFQAFDGWIVSCLPFFWKKFFMQERGIEHYSVRLQLKYYFRYKRTQETINEMTHEACRALWRNPRLGEDMILLSHRKDAKAIFCELGIKDQVEAYKKAKEKDCTIIGLMSNEAIEELCSNMGDMSMTHVYSDVIMAGKAVSDSHFEAIAKECPSLISEYVLRNTPSDGMLQCLISDEENFSKVISYCIRRYGLSAGVVSLLDKENLIAKYREDLDIHSCRVFLRGHDTEKNDAHLVSNFFLVNPRIPAEAQKEMELWQLELFFKMGRELHSDAITHFLGAGWANYAECIFKNIERLQLTPEQSAIVAANPRLTELAAQYGIQYMA